VVDLGAVLPLDQQQVAEPRRGHERGQPALALEDRVGGDGRAVHQVRNARERDTRRRQGRENAFLRTSRHARYLGDADFVAVQRNQVRERTADFDTNPHL
jgi:hypothetical protein